LAYLEAIHFFVEVLDSFFGNVCELDLVFNFYKVCGSCWEKGGKEGWGQGEDGGEEKEGRGDVNMGLGRRRREKDKC
jgi:hypothetical protein